MLSLLAILWIMRDRFWADDFYEISTGAMVAILAMDMYVLYGIDKFLL